MSPKPVSTRAQRQAEGITRMFRRDQVGRDELHDLRDSVPYEKFDIVAYTPGNDTAAAGRGPDNNLLPSEAITVDNVVSCLGGKGNKKRGLRVPVIDKYMAMICDHANASQVPPNQLHNTTPTHFHLLKPFHLPSEVDRTIWATNASAYLHTLPLTPDTLLQLHNLFIPITIRGTAGGEIWHTMLISICPQSQTLELLDSGGVDRHMNLYNDYFNLLNVHLGRRFRPREWRMRVNGTVRQGKQPTCALFATANAMCLAFNYPLDSLRDKSFNTRRRYILAQELMNGCFERDPNSRFWYPVLDRVQDRHRANGWTRLTAPVLAALPIEARARRGRYEGLTSKAAVTRWCRTDKRRYRGFTNWSRGTLVDYIEAVEVRDENIRMGDFVVPP